MVRKQKPLNFSLADDERLSLLRSKYPYIDDAYKYLGMDEIAKMSYHTSNIQRRLIAESAKLSNIAKVAKLLKTVNGFQVGAFITGKEIKEVLGNIYSTIGITSKPSIDDFRQFAVIEDKVKKIDGKPKRGFIIQYIKIR